MELLATPHNSYLDPRGSFSQPFFFFLTASARSTFMLKGNLVVSCAAWVQLSSLDASGVGTAALRERERERGGFWCAFFLHITLEIRSRAVVLKAESSPAGLPWP